jgi:tetratricopeptide (TPR) repeat protein
MSNLSRRLSHVEGKHVQALKLVEEAVGLLRMQESSRPGSCSEDLALLLGNLPSLLLGVDRKEDALVAAQEALSMYRELAVRNLDAYAPGLAKCFRQVAFLLDSESQAESALVTCQRAIELHRELFAKQPRFFHAELISSLRCLAIIYCRSGYYPRAVPILEEAIAILLPEFLGSPSAHRDLVRALLSEYVKTCEVAQKEVDQRLLQPLLPFQHFISED